MTDRVDLDDPFGDAQPEEVAHLRNGRYYYPRPEEEHTGVEYAHTRVTNFVKTLADNFALERWKVEQTVKGLTLDETLYLEACGHDLEDKRAFGRTAARAQERAGSSEGSTRGTAYHAFYERHDLGAGCTCRVPSWVKPKIINYGLALERVGLQVIPEYVERVVYVPKFNLVGRLDRILFDQVTGRWVIADLKSAREIWTACEWAVQLGLYANASHVWNPHMRLWEPMPDPMDLDRAVVIWMPLVHPDGKDEVTVEELPIRRGYEFAAQLCADARAWRSEGKNLLSRRPNREP
jgi:hypothetical protein